MHPEKITVWCASWTGGIIGPYVFRDDEGHIVTVNGERYRAMINPLLHTGHYCVRMTKILILKQEGIIKKISYERRAYESVDDSSLS